MDEKVYRTMTFIQKSSFIRPQMVLLYMYLEFPYLQETENSSMQTKSGDIELTCRSSLTLSMSFSVSYSIKQRKPLLLRTYSDPIQKLQFYNVPPSHKTLYVERTYTCTPCRTSHTFFTLSQMSTTT